MLKNNLNSLDFWWGDNGKNIGVFMSPIFQFASLLYRSIRDSASLFQGVTDMVNVHSLGHILWMTDVIVIFLIAKEL